MTEMPDVNEVLLGNPVPGKSEMVPMPVTSATSGALSHELPVAVTSEEEPGITGPQIALMKAAWELSGRQLPISTLLEEAKRTASSMSETELRAWFENATQEGLKEGNTPTNIQQAEEWKKSFTDRVKTMKEANPIPEKKPSFFKKIASAFSGKAA